MEVEEIISLLGKYGIKPKKYLGQNFLINNNVADKIVSASKLVNNDVVIEVGSGFGILTRRLCSYKNKVFAIEKDKLLCEYLKSELKFDNLTVINADIFKINLDDFGAKVKIISNLPYAITSDFLYWLLEKRNNIKLAVITLQKEVVDKILSPPRSKNYCAISVLYQFYMRIDRLFSIPCRFFYPQPNIVSSVVRLKPKQTSIDDKLFFRTVKICFAHRRKKLKNILKIKNGEINLNRRPDSLSYEEFATLTKCLLKLH